MKTVYIVGTGTNNPTIAAQEVIEKCDIIIGAKRQINDFGGGEKPVYEGYSPDAVCKIVAETDAEEIAVLVSGDTGFYSAARTLMQVMPDCSVKLVAGVPSVCEFASRLGISWQDAALLSYHGKQPPLVSTVRRNRLTLCLTGGNTAEIGKALSDAGYGGLTVCVGENLGYKNERIFTVKASGLTKTAALCVLMIENPEYDSRTASGLPDTAFIRLDGVPMTKSETRAVIMSKLRLPAYGASWDVGAGTGSVTIEMALHMYNGQVYAVESKREAVKLIQSNCRKHHVGNVEVVQGRAPDVLEQLPVPEVVFIGGSGGRMAEIVHSAVSANSKVRIVAAAVAVETVSAVLKSFEDEGVDGVELCQINISRAEKRAGLNMMFAQNPITVISGGGE